MNESSNYKMEPFLDFHLHSTGSDGAFPPKRVVDLAIKRGLKFICFTDHYPRPIDKKTQQYNPHSYYLEVLRLKAKYKNISIFYGAEYDWLESYEQYIKHEIEKRNYDYILGSVHFVRGKDGNLAIIDFSKESLLKIANELGSMQILVMEYYRQVRLMVQSKLFDSVAHLDLITKYNKDSCLFSEKDSWYQEEVFKTLDTIKKYGTCMEVNTSGLRHPVDELHPSKWVLEAARDRKIPITIGSDSHGQLFQYLDVAFKMVKDVGFKSIVRFDNRKMIKVEL